MVYIVVLDLGRHILVIYFINNVERSRKHHHTNSFFFTRQILLRYRTLCSSWLGLIDSPNFINLHLFQNTRSVSKFILKLPPWYGDINLYHYDFNSTSQTHTECRPDSNPLIYQVKFPTKRKPLWWNLDYDAIISSTNGLVYIFNFITCIFIINPSTRRYQKLPRIPVEKVRTYGFGFDKLNNDYKVVLNAPLRNIFKTLVLVYVLRSNLWKTLEFTLENVSFKTGRIGCCGVFVSGSIHWIVSRLNEHGVGNRTSGRNVIAAFDLASEEYRFMLLPDCSNAWGDACTMDDLQGCLCLSYGYFNYNSTNCKNVEVFMMKEYGVVESWTKLYVIELGYMENPVVRPRALSFSGGHRRVLLEVTWRGLLWYDLEDESVEHIKLWKEGSKVYFDCHYGDSVAISESLVPLSHPRRKEKTTRRSKRTRTTLISNPKFQA